MSGTHILQPERSREAPELLPIPAGGAAGAETRVALGKYLLLFHCVLVCGLVLGLLVTPLESESAGSLLPLLNVVLVALWIWMLTSWWMATGTAMDLYGLFVVMAFAFHGGYSILSAFGREFDIYLVGEISEASVARSLVLVIVCFAALHLGALLANTAVPTRPRAAIWDPAETRLVYFLGWAMLAVSLPTELIDMRKAVQIVSSGGYGALFLESRAPTTAGGTLVSLVSGYYIPGVMFLLASSKHRPFGRWTALSAAILYSGYYLYLGHRGYALLPLIGVAWIWHRTIRPLPFGVATASGAFVLLVVSPLVRQLRSGIGGDRFSLDRMVEAYTGVDNPLFAMLSEMGGSLLTISYTLELVPTVRPLEWGAGYLRALLNAVPIVDVAHPYGYASDWLAWSIKPYWAANGFGFGFSFIGEAFLNFGWFGAPIAILILGLLTALFVKWGDWNGDPARLAVIATFMPYFLFYVRGESIDLARPLLWKGALPFLVLALLRYMHQRFVTRSTPDGG